MTGSGKRVTVGEASLGWIGTGRMGQAMIPRLITAGHAVHIWSRIEHESELLAMRGATVVDSKQAVARCDVVFTIVSTTDDLKEILFGENGVIGPGVRLKLVVDSSSISLEGLFEIPERLEAAGVNYLSAPVSGNPRVTTAGKLLIVASGPKASYRLVEPYLQVIGGEAIWVGEGEIARVWKTAHNTLLGMITQSLCEITVLAQKAGIPRHVFPDGINKSVLGSLFTRYKTPTLTN